MTHKEYIQTFFKENKLTAFFCLLYYLGLTLVNIGVSWYIQVIIDLMAGEGPYSFRQVLIFFALSLIYLIVLNGVNYIAFPRFLRRAMIQYKDAAFEELLHKNLNAYSQESSATYLSALTNDALAVEENYLRGFFNLIYHITLFVGALTLMIYYSPTLTALAILISFLPLLVSLLTANRLADKEKQVSAQNASYVANLQDFLSGFSVIKNFQAEEEVQQLYQQANHDLEEVKYERERIKILTQSIGSFASILAQLGVMIIGAWMVLQEGSQLTAGIVLAFTNLMNFVLQPIGMVPNLFGQRRAAVALIKQLADQLSQVVSDEGLALTNSIQEGYQIADLSYSYDGLNPVLEGLDLTIDQGKAYAVVGASGSGKSTLLNLLMGDSSDYQGSIQLDSHELSAISTQSLYDQISLIQQNVFIFDASILNNITMFKDFSSDRISQVIDQAGLRHLVEDKGLDYPCGEGGKNLSGGERQRLAIARSLLKQAEILLVDEATSSLDNETAQGVSQSLLDLDQLTRVIVTHRLESRLLSQYDQIIALKDGRIEEQGTFEDLMALKGYFYSLYTLAN